MLEALALLNSILPIATGAMTALSQLRSVMAGATAEGRDLNPVEIASVREAMAAAEADWAQVVAGARARLDTPDTA